MLGRRAGPCDAAMGGRGAGHRYRTETGPDQRKQFGRRAMGETVRSGFLRDRITLRRGGKLLLNDMTRLSGDIEAALAGPATAGGATAMATIVLAGNRAQARLPALRAALAGAQAGASSFENIVLARLVAPDGFSLRNSLRSGLRALRGETPLPRVWQG